MSKDYDYTRQYMLCHGGDVKKLVTEKDYYRLRVGTYRIIFEMQPSENIIVVIKANNRGQIYK